MSAAAKRAKRAKRQAGYSLQAAMDVLAGALKAGKGVTKAAEVAAKPAVDRAPNKAQEAAADAFARSALEQIRGVDPSGIMPLRAVATWLNDLKVPTQTGGAWHATTVRNVKLRAASLSPVAANPTPATSPCVSPGDEVSEEEYAARMASAWAMSEEQRKYLDQVADVLLGMLPANAETMARRMNSAGEWAAPGGGAWTAQIVRDVIGDDAWDE